MCEFERTVVSAFVANDWASNFFWSAYDSAEDNTATSAVVAKDSAVESVVAATPSA